MRIRNRRGDRPEEIFKLLDERHEIIFIKGVALEYKIKDNSKIVRTLPARYESKNYIYYYLKGHHIVFQIIRRKAYLIMECQDEEIRDDEAYYFHFDDIHKRVIRDVIYQQRVISHEVYYPKSFSFEAVVQKGPYMAACFKKTIVMPSPGEWMPEESFRVQ